MTSTHGWVPQNTILLGATGSSAHGTASDDSDIDLTGICIEPPEYVLGLQHFEQYRTRDAPVGIRSVSGQRESVTYSLRKWARLAVAGNPSILTTLFLPNYDVLTTAGQTLVTQRHLFLSRGCATRFLGSLRHQRASLLGERTKRVHRAELVDEHGFDTKFAYHMIKIGVQGTQLLRTGTMTIPLVGEELRMLREIRAGDRTLAEVLDLAQFYEQSLVDYASSSELPAVIDQVAVDRFLVTMHKEHWEHGPLLTR